MLFWSIFHAFSFQMCWKIFCGLRSFLSFFFPQTSGSHNHPKNTLDNGKLYCHLANIRLFFFVHTLEMEDIYLTMVLFALTHFSLCHINHFSHTHTHTYRYIYIQLRVVCANSQVYGVLQCTAGGVLQQKIYHITSRVSEIGWWSPYPQPNLIRTAHEICNLTSFFFPLSYFCQILLST